MAEKMKNAGYNTLLGMGAVFIVLILISFIISLFKFISVIENSIANKKAAKQENVAGNISTINNAVETIEKNEAINNDANLVDDLELVAVITAAIAASEGTRPDGFYVRSIKRATKRNW